MVRRCEVCKRQFEPGDQNTSFHRFPHDSELLKIWKKIIGKENVSKDARICSSHFNISDLMFSPGGKRLLKTGAKPVLQSEKKISDTLEEVIDGNRLNEQPHIKRQKLEPLYGSCEPGPSTATSLTALETLPDESDVCVEESSILKERNQRGDILFDSPRSDSTTITATGSNFDSPRSDSTINTATGSTTATASETELILSLISGEEVSKKAMAIVPKKNVGNSKCLIGRREKRKPKIRRYFGDCETDDMDIPEVARRDWRIAKKTVAIQRTKIRRLQQINRRLKARVTCLNSLIGHLKEKYLITESAENIIEASLPGTSGALMKKVLKGSSHMKYTPELRAFALTLSFYSTKAYNYVRETFNKSLPHTSTISKWYRSINGSPGFCQEALQAIKIKVSELEDKGHKILCNLVMDEMAIMHRTEWTGSQFVGGTDHNIDIGTNLGGVQLPKATEVLVFMLVCINGHWKIPVGYLLINGLNGREKANVVVKLLEFLHESGAVITSLTFDGAPSNFSMVSALGAKLNDVSSLTTHFPHPITNQNIFIFPDICHCLKLVRNCIGDKLNFIDDEGNTISWSYYKRLAELQSEEGLQAGTKLRTRHINWVGEKMKVKLAAQLFSRSVSDAFIFLKDDMQMEEFQNVGATAKFTRIMNDLFDIFNSRCRYSKVQFRQALSIENADYVFEFLKTCEKYISQLKLNGELVLKSSRKTGFLGFIVCIRSLECIYKQYLIETPLLKYILSYKFSQDHLEIFFSIVRSKGGSNNNPTARQFQYIFKRLLIHSELKGSEHANSVAIDNTSILHCSSSVSRTDSGEDLLESAEYLKMSDRILEMDFLGSTAWHLTMYCSDIVAYIAGFVVRSLKKCVTCEFCLGMLEGGEILSKLQIRKKYGALMNASLFVVKICKAAEKSLRIMMNSINIFDKKYKDISILLVHTTMRNLPLTVFDAFEQHILDTDPLQHHPMELVKLILKKYFTVRLHHEANKLKDSTGVRVRSMLTKTILFKNQ